MSQTEDTLAFQLMAAGISFEREYRFHPTRKWRTDFIVDGRLLVEVEGAIRGKPGRHQRVDGVDADCTKYAEAMLMGWPVLRVSARMARDGRALQYIERLLEASKVAASNGTQALTCAVSEEV